MNDNNIKIPHINVVIKENDIENGIMRILEVIRPFWNRKHIQFKLLTDGITNKLVGCRPGCADESETVLVRMYGNKTDLLIDRKAEVRNIVLLNEVNLAPDLYATFENGLAYKFVPGCTLNENTITNPNIYKLVAKRLARLHKVKVKDVDYPKPNLWTKMQTFLDLVPDNFNDSSKNLRYKEIVTPKEKIEQEITFLRNILENLGSPTVFAHNDLLLGNIIYTDKNDVIFIDYEYAAFNYQAFDIGNHFAEFVGLGEIDYTRYPSKEVQFDWLQTYLTEYNSTQPTQSEVEKLYVQVNQFALISHLFWGVWALIQAEHSFISYDFVGYAAIRFNEYFDKKEKFLALK